MIGYVSITGPLLNISLAVVFALFAETITVGLYGVDVLLMASRVNTFLALSNLVPIYPMDGYKVLRWSSTTYLFTLGMALLTFFLIPPGFL